MIEAGELTTDDRVELLDGELVDKMPKNPSHSLVTRKLDRRLMTLVDDGWHVRNQEPVTLSASEPEPDLAVVRGTEDDYGHRKPGPADTALVVEVADSTVARDRRKRTIYAAAGLPEYWIVNLPEDTLERYTEPAGDRYAREGNAAPRGTRCR